MKIPKRFKLQEATGPDAAGYTWEAVLLTKGRLVASDGHVLAVVPVLPEGDRSGRDLPRLEPGEGDGPSEPVLLPLEAVKAASQGKTGEGELRVHHDKVRDDMAYGRPGPDKSWTVAPLRDGSFPAGWAEKEGLPAPASLGDTPARVGADVQLVEVILDAERLVRAARAIGAAEGLRVRFYVRDGRLADDAPVLELRPAREPEGGPWAALGGQIIDDQD